MGGMFGALLGAATLAALLLLSPARGGGAAGGTPTPLPTPTPYKPLPVPSPLATPWSPLSLGGVAIADSADDVRGRLGPPFLTNEKPEISIWTYPMDMNHVSLNVFMRHGRVSGVTASLAAGAKQSLFTDPFGVHLGDGVDVLLSTRGTPSKQAENRSSFSAGPAFDWDYQFDHGIAASIALNASVPLTGPLPNPVPGPTGHDGSSIDKAIRFKGVSGAQAQLTEYVFLAQWCDGKGTWTPTDRSVLTQEAPGLYLEVQSVMCSTTQRAAKFYFNRSRG